MKINVLIFSLLILSVGCSMRTTYRILDVPTVPASSMIVTIDSIPSGAEVYELTKQGTLGERMGTTPLQWRFSFGQQLMKSENDGKTYHHDWVAWGLRKTRFAEWNSIGNQKEEAKLNMNFCIVKDGYAPKIVENLEVAHLTLGSSWPSDTTHRIILGHAQSNGLAVDRDYTIPSGSGGSDYQQAKQEYDNALAAYEKALSDLDNAKNLKALSDLSSATLAGGSKVDRVFGVLGQATSHLSLQEAERNVVVARERLQRAEARLDAMNWRK